MEYIKDLNVKELKHILSQYNSIVKIPKVSQMKRPQLEKVILQLFDLSVHPSYDTMHDYYIKATLKPNYDFTSIEELILQNQQDEEYEKQRQNDRENTVGSLLSMLQYVNDKENYKLLKQKTETLKDLLQRRKAMLNESNKKYYSKTRGYKKLKNWIPKAHLFTVIKKISN